MTGNLQSKTGVRAYTLFTLFRLKTTISPFGVFASVLIALPVLTLLAALTASLSFGEALSAAILGLGVMFVSEYLHQLGHAFAARRVGYPMIGVHFSTLLSTSVYPRDEPPLPPGVHIRRALGGFWVNVVIGLLLAPYAFFLWFGGGVRGWLVAFTAVYNFFVLGLGALLPIDIPGVFTIDGGTILRYWRERRNH